MNFEICIQGPRAEIIKLFRLLKRFSPRLRRLHDPYDDRTPGRLEIALKRNLDPSLLNKELLSISNAMAAFGKAGTDQGLFDMRVRNLDYSEPSSGSDGFLEAFRPISSILVEPWSPGLRRRVKSDCIYLDPGHAFGTGKHPTTRLCLQVLDNLIRSGLLIRRALDFGCGTGILAIAAVRLGVRHALGVEMDGPSAKTAKRNVRLNLLEQRIEVREGSWEAVQGSFDLILANLVASALLRTGARIAPHLEDGGWAIVSGFGTNQVGEVLPLLEKNGLVLDRQYGLDGWVGLLLRKGTHIESAAAARFTPSVPP
jgi:ribosomal protein L11 methylase PrmA